MKTFWDTLYENGTQEDFTWNKISYDFIPKILKRYDISGEKVLEIGASTGEKLNYLSASQRFQTIRWIELSPKVKKHVAKDLQKKYIYGDMLSAHTLKHQRFDCILDWSMLHCIPPHQRKQYVTNIHHIAKPGCYILFRAFAHTEGKTQIIADGAGKKGKYYFCSEEEILKLYHNFTPLVIEHHHPSHLKDWVYFIEILFQK